MNNSKTILLLSSLTFFPNLVLAKDVTLTCPSSGEGSAPLELTLTAAGGFELPKDQSMFLPIQFHHSTVDRKSPEQKVTFSCFYISSTDKPKEQKTIMLVAHAPPGSTKCDIVSSSKKEAKMNRLACTYP